MTEYRLQLGKRHWITLAPACDAPRDPALFHCCLHHAPVDTSASLFRHRMCALVYLCPDHGPELPFGFPVEGRRTESPVEARNDGGEG